MYMQAQDTESTAVDEHHSGNLSFFPLKEEHIKPPVCQTSNCWKLKEYYWEPLVLQIHRKD